MIRFIILFFTMSTSLTAQGQLSSPALHLSTQGLQVSLHWSAIKNATGYQLFYAPFPFKGEHTIASIDLGQKTEFIGELWQGAAFYTAIKAYDNSQQNSEYSNIGFFQIKDRGKDYQQFWATTTKEIEAKTFTSDDFLYNQTPDVASCFSGELSYSAKLRTIESLNQIRTLHRLPFISYDETSDNQVQQAALIQKANNFLSHTPASSAACYSQAGYEGSNSSNLHLGSFPSDPAADLINLINDAANISNLKAVGHRRALLNPFLAFTSYGQVLGASAVKVFNFSDDSTSSPDEIPNFVAFPYLRYPYSFFSDLTSNKKTPWSISIIEDNTSLRGNQHEYFAQAKVTVKRKDNGQILTIDNIYTDTNAVGVPNLLSWTVNEWKYDTWYSVSIENIETQSSLLNSLQYDVFIDYKNLIDLNFPLEGGDQQNEKAIRGSLFTSDDKDSFTLTLAGTVTFLASSQYSNLAFFMSLYNADKQLVISKDDSFSLELPAGEYTLKISNCNEQQACYSSAKNYNIQIN